MIPIRVCAEGFMSYRDRAELNFEGSSLWMLTGKNGAGKSVIFDAVTYVLYGFHRLGDNKNYSELINKNSSQMSVEFDFAVDRDLFRVKRTHQRKGRGTFQAWQCRGGYSENGAIADYEKNLIPVAGTDKEKGFNDWVRETIGLDKKAFPAAVLLRQGETDALLTADPSQRHPILAQIVDLSKYQKLYERAVEKRKKFNYEQEQLKAKLENCEPVELLQIEKLTGEIETAKTDSENAARQCEELIDLKVRAEHWEKLVAEDRKLESEISRAEILFASENQIESDAFEAENLNKYLPILVNLFSDRRRLENLNEQKREFENLGTDISDLQESLSRCETARRAFPHWQNYCQTRSEWHAAKKSADSFIRRLSEVEQEISRIQTEFEEADGFSTEAENQRNETKNALERAKINSENAERKNQRFIELNDAAVCDSCGQALTAEHRTAESARLEKDLRETQSEQKKCRAAFEQADAEFIERKNECSAFTEQLENLRDEKKETTRNLKTAEDNQKRSVRDAAGSLSALHEIALSPLSSITDVELCFTQTYPAVKDLEDTQQQSRLYDGQKKLLGELNNKRERISPALGQLDIVAENVSKSESSLPQEWLERSFISSENDLRAFEARAEVLKEANQKLEDLRKARNQQEARKSRRAGIADEIGKIKTKARRAVSEIEIEEAAVKLRKEESEGRLKFAETEKRNLENRREQREQLEKDWGKAAHKFELYKELAKQLSADYLQRQLLQDAEKSIVAHANRLLDRVSGGSLRLELKAASAPDTAGGAKALDLRAYYEKAGLESLPVDALSGGQRFRVAVSLALGIGQYASSGTRRLESVIIDEGFGSLDREGRDEMISELHQLKNELRRIIIVSHQEEVAQVFANNKYLIEHSDGSSRVKLMDGFE